MMPFLMFTYVAFWAGAYRWLAAVAPRRELVAFVIALIVAIPLWCDVPVIRKPGTFSRTATDLMTAENRWERLDRLSAFGSFLKQSLPPHALVASSEMATIFYFSETEILDLLGLANVEVARAPLTPWTALNPMNRRRDPSTIDHHKPDLLVFYEMAGRLEKPIDARDSTAVIATLKQLNVSDDSLEGVQYHAGRLTRFEGLGYRHVAVFVPGFYFNYWVREPAYAAHRAKLEELGLKLVSDVRIPYRLPGELLERFP
jgi:hypothetical protein